MIQKMLLLQTQEIFDKTLEINPYGTTAIGVLFAVLLFAIFFLWRQLEKKDKDLESEVKYGRELSEKVVTLMTKVGEGFDSDREFKARVEANITAVRQDFKLLDQYIREDARKQQHSKQS